MSTAPDVIEAPLDRAELTARWQALCFDPVHQGIRDLPGKVELNQWGEMVVMSPVGKTHALMSADLAQLFVKVLGGRALVEVGILTDLGVRAPDVAWCSDAFLQAHPEEAPLSAAPELCVEVVSPNDTAPPLREKSAAYVRAGAIEAWIVFPQSRRVEIYAAEGKRAVSSFGIDLEAIFT